MIKFQKRRIWKNKRGDDMLIDFWAIFIFAIILLLFFILFAVNKTINDKKVQTEFKAKDAEYMLESFLRAPALEGTDSTKTIGDIIVEDSTTGDFTRTEKLFDAFFKRMSYYDIQLRIEGDHSNSYGIEDHSNEIEASIAETYIPGYEKKVYVKLRVIRTGYISFT